MLSNNCTHASRIHPQQMQLVFFLLSNRPAIALHVDAVAQMCHFGTDGPSQMEDCVRFGLNPLGSVFILRWMSSCQFPCYRKLWSIANFFDFHFGSISDHCLTSFGPFHDHRASIGFNVGALISNGSWNVSHSCVIELMIVYCSLELRS